jgi:RNA polymerase sigma-70 factor (ECF subfamily)
VDEQKLVLALRDGDPAALRELLSANGDRLLRSAFWLCGSEAEAQDLAQETFLQALQSLHRFRAQSGVYTWLHGILLNLSRHYHRDRQRIVYDDELVGHAAALAEEEESPSPIDVAMTRSALAQALGQLSGPHREVLILRFYENMKLREIARHLGISKGTVKSRLHYAIGQMQQLLPREMNLFGARGTEKTERT